MKSGAYEYILICDDLGTANANVERKFSAQHSLMIEVLV